MRIAILGLQNKRTKSLERNGRLQREERKEERGEKKESEDINKNPEGRRVKEMESVKKERKSAAAV